MLESAKWHYNCYIDSSWNPPFNTKFLCTTQTPLADETDFNV